MKWRSALIFIVLGIVMLAGWLPGDVATGPRIGIGLSLILLGLFLVAGPTITWYLRKTTRPEDYKGTCPAGESCADCGAFNLKPRASCRSCGQPVNQIEAEAL